MNPSRFVKLPVVAGRVVFGLFLWDLEDSLDLFDQPPHGVDQCAQPNGKYQNGEKEVHCCEEEGSGTVESDWWKVTTGQPFEVPIGEERIRESHQENRYYDAGNDERCDPEALP